MPEPIQSMFTAFERLLILRTIRPDKLIPAVTLYIVN